MQTIFSFLTGIARNNNREWFAQHRAEYDEAQARFARAVGQLIPRIARFDPSVGHVGVKSTLYRFYRDTRFSPDKSPYKRHFGAYINARGKKSMHGGYYLHIEPGNSMIAGGDYCLTPKVLREVRQSIVDRTGEYLGIIENPTFKSLFPVIGMERLKGWPAGFSRDYAHPELIRPKEYCVSHSLPDAFFSREDWLDRAAEMFGVMKPFLDFVNDTVDDYI